MIKLRVPEWCCAIRFNSKSSNIIDDTDAKFTVIKDSYRYWTADPFLFKKEEKYYLFFEMFDRLKRKGLLGCREISENGFGKMRIIYECRNHLSYPYIFEYDDDIFIIPECEQSGELFLLKCVKFPTEWKKEKVLINQRLVDTTPITFEGVNYFISEIVDDKKVFDRVDLFYEENGSFFECKSNPAKVDLNSARCAGKVFKYNSSLVRPSQDCSRFYGEKLNFNRITKISKDEYREEIIKSVSVNDIKTDGNNNFIGIHTYNRIDNIEVIDLMISDNFNVLNIIGALLKKIRNIIN